MEKTMNNQIEETTDQIELSLDDLASEDFFIPISTSNLEGIAEYNEVEFKKGLDDVSYVCGQITGLRNCGLSSKDALDYLITVQTLKHNMEVSEITSNMNIEVAKYVKRQAEEQEM